MGMLGSRKTREGKVATVRPRDGELSHERFSCLRVLLGRVLFHIPVARVCCFVVLPILRLRVARPRFIDRTQPNQKRIRLVRRRWRRVSRVR